MKIIKHDFFRYSQKSYSFWNLLSCFFSVPAFRFLWISRYCTKTSAISPIGFGLRLIYKRMFVKYGYQIPFNTRIGPGLYIGHFGNIVINQKTTLGSNCNIHQGVTIGMVNRGAKQGCPMIGDRVWIGANSVIVGNIKIGNDVLIAPLSYVTENIPDNAVVAGNPAQVINYNGSKGYINNILNA